jgi:hypothetical protein
MYKVRYIVSMYVNTYFVNGTVYSEHVCYVTKIKLYYIVCIVTVYKRSVLGFVFQLCITMISHQNLFHTAVLANTMSTIVAVHEHVRR